MNTLPILSSDGQNTIITISEEPASAPKDFSPTVVKAASVGKKIPALKRKMLENELGSEKKVRYQKAEIPRLQLSAPSFSSVPASTHSASPSPVVETLGRIQPKRRIMRRASSLRPVEGPEIRLRKTRSVSHAMNRLNESRREALKQHQEMFEDLSLLSPKRRKARGYYPGFEYHHLRNVCANSFSFDSLSLAKSQKNRQMVKQLLARFNSQLGKCSRRKIDLTVEFAKSRLFSVCNEEIKLLLDQNPSSITSLSLSDSPRVKELATVVEESGVLLYPMIYRLILLTSQLIKLNQSQGYYTAWSRELYGDLLALIKPDNTGGFYRKKLGDFLKKFDELISSRGKKTTKVLKHVLALNPHDNSPLIRYSKNWNCPEPEFFEDFENLVKTSTWQNIKFSGLSNLKFDWFQSTAEKPCINQIIVREIIRCFGNEDNGVVIIPNEIRVGGKIVHDSNSSHRSIREFFNLLVGKIYRAGLLDYPVRDQEVENDVEALLCFADGNYMQTVKVFSKVYPQILLDISRSVNLWSFVKFYKDRPAEIKKFPYLIPRVREYLSYANLPGDQESHFIEKWLLPRLTNDLIMLYRVKNGDVDLRDELAIERLLPEMRREFTNFMDTASLVPDEIVHLVMKKIIPGICSDLDKGFTCGDEVAQKFKLAVDPEVIQSSISQTIKKIPLPVECMIGLLSENTHAVLKTLFMDEKEVFRLVDSEEWTPFNWRITFSDAADLLKKQISFQLLQVLDEVLQKTHLTEDAKDAIQSRIKISIRKRCEAAASIIFDKRTTFKEQLFDRIFLYAFKEVASSLSKGKAKEREGSVLMIKRYQRLMTKELMSVCVAFGLTKEEVGKLFYHRFLKRIGDFTTESMTSSSYRTENSLLRMNRLLKVLRLCTNSCWFFADQCVKRVFPRIHSLPYSVKYKQGSKLNVTIIDPNSYQVKYFKRLFVNSAEKLSTTSYVLEVPFCWTVQTLSDGWKGALEISSKPSFPDHLDPIDRWQAIYQLLHWELPETEMDAERESSWVTSHRALDEQSL